MKESRIGEQWITIRQTGCPNIQDAINGRSVEDFDPDMIEWMADFVFDAPPDTQASIQPDRERQ